MTRLSLTFDNGPTPKATNEIVAALASRGVTATFFMVGSALLSPVGTDTARRVLNAGHAIGNHTMTHGRPLGEGADLPRVEAEIGVAQEILDGLGVQDRLFRPNGRGRLGPHLLSAATVSYLVRHRFTVVTWNCVVQDWRDPPHIWMERALRALRSTDWTVLVLHDEHVSRQLPELLAQALDAGVEITTEFPTSCVPIRA